jgi:PPM family protein phosphatase
MPDFPMPETTETLEFAGIRPARHGADPARPPIRIEFAAISHPGKVRSNNEDHFLINRMGRTFDVVSTNMPPGGVPDHVEEVAYGMVVADGMGGMAAGEKASQLAIRTGVDLVLNSPMWATRIDDQAAQQLISRMREYFRKVDSVVIGEAMTDRHLSGMGTTLTFAYIINTDAFIVHVGDSRAYLFRKGKLEQLTRDHTMAQGLADLGAIRPEEVHRHAKRHVLTNFVGGPSSGVEPEVATVQLRDGDYLLLCSDGLTEMVEDSAIARTLCNATATDSAARVLIDLALAGGGRDNVTVVLARIEVPEAG